MMRVSSFFWWAAAGLVLIAVGFVSADWIRFNRVPTAVAPAPPPRPAVKAVGSIEARTETFCGGCHRMPDPAYFSRDLWDEEVRRGFFLHSMSLRVDLIPPPQAEVASYFRARAPGKLELRPPQDEPSGSVRFREINVAPADANLQTKASVSFVRRLALNAGEPPVLVACDMASGELLAIDPAAKEPAARQLASVGHPAHFEPCDLDADGATDLVVADLGSFLPADHHDGRVLWLRNTGAGGYDAVTLLDKIGRVADARPADFDGDGDEDLVVAEFGWHSTGAIRLLLNEPAADGAPRFTPHVIDGRHGTIHVPVTDWNDDGRPDFLALISQEYETVELFVNQSGGRFTGQTVVPSEDPSFGSSGIEQADLDGDGDRDVLYTNGDTFDSHELKPYHGIQWAENRGPEGWETHRLTDMPGVHRALAADLDGDGDQDIAASALVTEMITLDSPAASQLDSVIWLEQVRPGEFVRHGVERGLCHHAAMELGDFDGDGRIDIAVGNFRPPAGRSPVRIWMNLPAPSAPATPPAEPAGRGGE